MSKIKNCAGKDGFERMNYLYQISNLTLSNMQDNPASSLYSHLLLNVAQKCVQRMEPAIKRSICKQCHALLVTGVTAKVRIKKGQVRFICNTCKASKMYKTAPNYKIWIEEDEAVLEKLEY